jgi:hypothetical protein
MRQINKNIYSVIHEFTILKIGHKYINIKVEKGLEIHAVCWEHSTMI